MHIGHVWSYQETISLKCQRSSCIRGSTVPVVSTNGMQSTGSSSNADAMLTVKRDSLLRIQIFTYCTFLCFSSVGNSTKNKDCACQGDFQEKSLKANYSSFTHARRYVHRMSKQTVAPTIVPQGNHAYASLSTARISFLFDYDTKISYHITVSELRYFCSD